MEKKELLKVWATKLIEDLDFPEDDMQVYTKKFTTILDTLFVVYEVGVQDGKDQEKLARQLQGLGRPHGATGDRAEDNGC